MFGVGTTFHFEGGLQGEIPTGRQLVCFEAWRAGLDALPGDLEQRARFKNAGWADSPVKSADFTRLVRAYTADAGTEAYTILIGVSGDPNLTFRSDWEPVDWRRPFPAVWWVRSEWRIP